MNDIYFVYVTTPNLEEAEKIANTVVELRLASCANIINKVRSIYWWKGKIEKANELSIILKCSSNTYKSLEDKIKELHSYECPCIVAIPIEKGNSEYLEWVNSECLDQNEV